MPLWQVAMLEKHYQGKTPVIEWLTGSTSKYEAIDRWKKVEVFSKGKSAHLQSLLVRRTRQEDLHIFALIDRRR